MYVNNKDKRRKDECTNENNGFKNKETLLENREKSRIKNLILTGIASIVLTFNVLGGCGRTELICVEGIDCPTSVESKDGGKIPHLKDVSYSDDAKNDSQEDAVQNDKDADSEDSALSDVADGGLDEGLEDDSEIADVKDAESRDAREDAVAEDDGAKDAGMDESYDVSEQDAISEQDGGNSDVITSDDIADTESKDGENASDVITEDAVADIGSDSGIDSGVDTVDDVNDVASDVASEDASSNNCVEESGEREELIGTKKLESSTSSTSSGYYYNISNVIYYKKYCENGEQKEYEKIIGQKYTFYTDENGKTSKCVVVAPDIGLYNLGIFNVRYDIVSVGESPDGNRVDLYRSLYAINRDANCKSTQTYYVLIGYYGEDHKICNASPVHEVTLGWAGEERNYLRYGSGPSNADVSYGGYYYEDGKQIHRLFVYWGGPNSQQVQNILIKEPGIISTYNNSVDYHIVLRITELNQSSLKLMPVDDKVSLINGVEIGLPSISNDKINYETVTPSIVIDGDKLCEIKLEFK